jgi:hypothetical protein
MLDHPAATGLLLHACNISDGKSLFKTGKRKNKENIKLMKFFSIRIPAVNFVFNCKYSMYFKREGCHIRATVYSYKKER